MDLSNLIDLARAFDAGKERTANLSGLDIYCREAVSEIEGYIYEPVLCLVLQGRKIAAVGDHLVELKAGDALLVSHDLPVISRITQASKRKPYIALILGLDMGLVRSLCDQLPEKAVPDPRAEPLSTGQADQAWLAPLVRYMELIHDPVDAKVLGPATLREIHYRLLLTPIGQMLRKLVTADSHASRIAKAIGRLRSEFRATLSVADLAKNASMGTSAFHEHFKSITGTIPRQYQKDLQLIEARALLLGQSQSVAQVAFAVGYESPTHFSRDYRKKFGVPPSRDSGAGMQTG